MEKKLRTPRATVNLAALLDGMTKLPMEQLPIATTSERGEQEGKDLALKKVGLCRKCLKSVKKVKHDIRL